MTLVLWKIALQKRNSLDNPEPKLAAVVWGTKKTTILDGEVSESGVERTNQFIISLSRLCFLLYGGWWWPCREWSVQDLIPIFNISTGGWSVLGLFSFGIEINLRKIQRLTHRRPRFFGQTFRISHSIWVRPPFVVRGLASVFCRSYYD